MEGLGNTTVLTIHDQSMVAEARRQVASIGRRVLEGEAQQGRIALVVTELVTNLLKHAGGGELLLTVGCDGEGEFIDILAIDRGPGIVDVAASMRDGHSTSGSPGTGLGAAARLASSFDLYSNDRGTVIHARMRDGSPAGSGRVAPMDISGICIPHPGEILSGDGWTVTVIGETVTALVVDGLGHGPLANAAAVQALAAFRRVGHRRPAEIINEIHASLRATRGAVAAVARLDDGAGEVTFAGIGNITGMIAYDGGPRRLVSHNGTLGAQVRVVQEHQYPAAFDSVLILHSDGLSTHIDLAQHPGLLRHSAAVIAGVLYREQFRGSDDATVVVVGGRPPRQ